MYFNLTLTLPYPYREIEDWGLLTLTFYSYLKVP